jgi:hypothetical protein
LGRGRAGDSRITHTVKILGPGDLAPDGGAPPSLDADKLQDMILYLEYGVET